MDLIIIIIIIIIIKSLFVKRYKYISFVTSVFNQEILHLATSMKR